MLIESAVADAYGACFEFTDSNFILVNNTLSTYIQHPTHKDLIPGCYTDDTQMTIAICELIIQHLVDNKKNTWIDINIADKFIDVFNRDERIGYSQGFYKLLKSCKNGKELLHSLKPDSKKNGAVMRSGPIGIYDNIDTIIQICKIQSSITHDSPDGLLSSTAAALINHYFIYKLGSKNDLRQFIRHIILKYYDKINTFNWSFNWNRLSDKTVSTNGIDTILAVITAIESTNSLYNLIKYCVNYGGDTDTVASIAVSAASCDNTQFTNDIPTSLFTNFESGGYGLNFILSVDSKLQDIIIDFREKRGYF